MVPGLILSPVIVLTWWGGVGSMAREAFVVIICNSNITSWTPETIASLDAHGETLFHHPWLICVPRVLFYNSPP